MNIVRKHLGVKPDVTLEQPRRGSITITPEKYTVILGKHSDLSTLIHETGHIFEEELRRIAASGVGDPRILEDLGKLDSWLSRFDDDAVLQEEYASQLQGIYGDAKFADLTAGQKEDLRNIAKREYFARGFEAYAREGKTPSEGLRGVFDRFKRWLVSIYKDAKSLGVEMNDDVRGVFERMLATEEEIAVSAAANELTALEQSYLDSLNVTPAERE